MHIQEAHARTVSIKSLQERVARLEKLGVRKEPPLIDFKELNASLNKFEKTGVQWPTGLHLAIAALSRLDLYDKALRSLTSRIRLDLREFHFRIKQLEDSNERHRRAQEEAAKSRTRRRS